MITGVGLTYIRSKVTAYRKNLILRKEKKRFTSESCVSKSFKSSEELWSTWMTAFGALGELSEANHAELKLAASKIQPSTWHPHTMLPWSQTHHITQLSQCCQLFAFKSTAEWIAAVHMQPAPAWRQQAQLLDEFWAFFSPNISSSVYLLIVFQAAGIQDVKWGLSVSERMEKDHR